MINEVSQGAGDAKEWVEILVVTDGLDLRGWELSDGDDGGSHPICTFADHAAWSYLPAGTLIAVYNGGDVDPVIDAEDLDFSDQSVRIAHDNTDYFVDAAYGWPGNGVFGNGDPDDCPVLRDELGQLVHDMAVTHPVATVYSPFGGFSRAFMGNTTAGLLDDSNWSDVGAALATPGTGNGAVNTAWIEWLRNSDLPSIAFAITSAATVEGNTALSIPIVISTATSVTTTVTLSPDATCQPADFSLSTNQLLFAEGNRTNVVVVYIVDDGTSEPAETIVLQFSNTTGAIHAPFSNRLTIAVGDNDPATLLFAATTITVHEVSSNALLGVQRWGQTNTAVSASCSFSNGTAAAGVDFTSTNGTVVIPAGETVARVSIRIVDDAIGEHNETLTAWLTDPSPGVLIGQPDTALVTIIDDENAVSNYYADVAHLKGEALRTALHDLIDDHTEVDYSRGGEYVPEIDSCPTNPTQVWLLYSQAGADADTYGVGNRSWNREHVWPKSHGFQDATFTLPPVRDLHNLRAVDGDINLIRASRDFDEGGAHVPETPPTCRTDSDSFEPPDAAKGDVARIVFYMDIRYVGNAPNEPNLAIVDTLPSDGPELARLSRLMAWHFADPPDAFERRRNDLIYRNWQGNRNPFIDHPEWVEEFWGTATTAQGVPHWWLMAHNLQTNDAAAAADSDGDGLFNWQEYVADTHPTNAASQLPAITYAARLGHQLRLRAEPVSTNRTYNVQGATHLRPPVIWIDETPEDTPTRDCIDLTVTNRTPSGFYRIRVHVP